LTRQARGAASRARGSAPKKRNPDWLGPVSWALGIYGAFTLLRLLPAYRDRLSLVLKIASVVLDVSMLMSTIWSFHIEYGQPPALYLKSQAPAHGLPFK